MKTARSSLYNTSSLCTGLIAGLVLSVTGLGAKNAFANPSGASGSNVASGQVVVTQSGNTETITQTIGQAVINWQSFNILTGETTKFIQPSSSSVALNRITSGSPTEILGALDANGHLILINPNGVFFGKGSTVNVAGLIASTAGISNKNFLAGNYNFNHAGKSTASIINDGTITAAQGGLVALVAPGVVNNGVISAHAGTVILGAGKTFTLDFYGDNLYSFAIGKPSTTLAKDQNGKTLSAALINSGLISAKGGNVLLTARVAGGLVNEAINTSGIIEATAAHKGAGGSIILDGGDGNVTVAGILNASGKHKGQKGGNVTVLGQNITLTSTALVDASGAVGGGTVNIGGNSEGNGPLPNANTVTVDAGSVINVSALYNGNGGSVVLWSNSDTEAHGSIFARGGKNGGNGGTIETSGGTLNVAGIIVDASAPGGNGGTWLLDPSSIVIDPTLASTISTDLNLGMDVVIDTNSPPAGSSPGSGTIEVASNITKTSGSSDSLTLNATTDITVDSGVTISSSNNALGVTLDADRGGNGGYISLQGGSSIISNGGNITLEGGGVNGAAVSDNANLGGITIGTYGGSGATLDARGPGDTGGNISLNGTAYLGGDTTWDGVDLLSGSHILTQGRGNITVSGMGSTQPTLLGGINLNSSGVWLENATVQAENGAITITGIGRGPGGYLPDYGIVFDGSTVATTGTGSLTFNGTGGPGAPGIVAGISTPYITFGGSTFGGASQKGDITFEVTGDMNLANSHVTTSGNILVNPANFALNASSVSGGNVTINATNVTLTGSTITATTPTTGTLAINNTGTFSSDTKHALLGAIVKINQNLPGSIQNAIDAINPSSGTSTLNVGNGIWDQTAVINGYNSFGLVGSGEWNGATGTLIQPTSGGVTSIVFVQNGSGDNVSGLSIDGSKLSGNTTGIAVDNSSNGTITGNQISNVTTSISVDPSSYIMISGNTIDNATTAISVDGGSNNTITTNSIINATTGIDLENNTRSTIGANTITDAKTGILVNGGSNNTIDINTVTDAGTGISVANSNYATMIDNTVDHVGTGIRFYNSNYDTLFSNDVDGARTGIYATNSNHNTLEGNSVYNAGTGISYNGGSYNTINSNIIVNDTTGISINGESNDTINGNSVYNIGVEGIDVTDSSGINVNGNTVTGTGTGINFNNVSNSNIGSTRGNTISGFTTGISVDPSSNITISGNTIDNVGTGITVSDLTGTNLISNNTVYDTGADAIDAYSTAGLTISGNYIGTIGGAYNVRGSGIYVQDSNGLLIETNEITNTFSTANQIGSGIYISGDTNDIIEDNTITNTNWDGIKIEGGSNYNIAGNTINGTTRVGIWVNNVSTASITDNNVTDTNLAGYGAIETNNGSNMTITGNTVSNAPYGIYLNGTAGSNLVENNTISAIAQDGIIAATVDNLAVTGNTVTSTNGSGIGINVVDDTGTTTIGSNSVNNFGIGIGVTGTDDVQFASNAVTGTPGTVTVDFATDTFSISGGSIGVLLTNSNGATFTGDTFISNNVGIELNGSPNTTINGVTLTNNGVGLYALNGSSGTLVNDTTFTDNVPGIDSIGIALDGLGTSLSFAPGTTSYFTGQTLYFSLANSVMDGEIIDASNQSFGETLGQDFTLGEYNQAESQTFDSHTPIAGVGTVCYNTTCSAPSSGIGLGPSSGGSSLDNVFLVQNEEPLVTPSFSFAGQTILQDPPSFTVQGVNLSLLASATGSSSVFIGSSGPFQNLSPAAGGDTVFASLSPSAGGIDTCGNGFLGNGFALNYNAAACNKQIDQ